MDKAKVTKTGQVTIPKWVRNRLGLRPRDELEFVEDGGGFHLRKYMKDSALKDLFTVSALRSLMKPGASRDHSKQKACGSECSGSTTALITPPNGG